ncbi:hypothetical protein BKI52_22025 [marine bacterium AO1-C]|nr:hypothetical protein BKI52_22025 [marine bacterium AO1-C]
MNDLWFETLFKNLVDDILKTGTLTNVDANSPVRLRWNGMNLDMRNLYFENNLFEALKSISREKTLSKEDLDFHIRYLETALLDYIYYLYAAGLEFQLWKQWCFLYSQINYLAYKFYSETETKAHYLYASMVFCAISNNWPCLDRLKENSLEFNGFVNQADNVVWHILRGLPSTKLHDEPMEDNAWVSLQNAFYKKDKVMIFNQLKLIAEDYYDFFEFKKYTPDNPSFNPVICATTAYLSSKDLIVPVSSRKLKKKQAAILVPGLTKEKPDYNTLTGLDLTLKAFEI